MINSVVRSLYRVALTKTDHLFFQNEEDLALCANEGLIPRERARVIPGSGVDLSAYTPNARGRVSARDFLIFGRLLPQKGFGDFLEAGRILRSEIGEQATFSILGSPDPDRPESIALYESIKSAHELGYIRYLGAVDDVRPVLSQCDVVVLPSTYNEGVPRSLLEALASGKPIITTDWKGCRETVVHGANGLLIPPHVPGALVAAMRHMIVASDEQIQRMGQASRVRAENRFDEKVVLAEYAKALGLPSEI
jgi:glycosyltransferase involved in cell wall biosynthesis